MERGGVNHMISSPLSTFMVSDVNDKLKFNGLLRFRVGTLMNPHYPLPPLKNSQLFAQNGVMYINYQYI